MPVLQAYLCSLTKGQHQLSMQGSWQDQALPDLNCSLRQQPCYAAAGLYTHTRGSTTGTRLDQCST